jgi:hypothetical protein
MIITNLLNLKSLNNLQKLGEYQHPEIPVVSFTALSVFQTIQRRMASLVKNELEGIWKEAIMAYSRHCPRICLG